MKCPLGKLFAIAAIAGAIGFSSVNAQSTVMKKSVWSAGGHQNTAYGSSGTKTLSGTFGQLAITQIATSSTSDKIYQGFWPNPYFLTGVPDVISSNLSSLTNFPNPFNGQTTISYNLPGEASVSLKVYNANGSLISEIFNGVQGKGSQTFVWDTKSNNGGETASGTYMLVLSANPTNMVGGDAFVAINERIAMIHVK